MQNTLYSLLSCHVVKKQDVRVGQFHTLSHNTMYLFEWFWRNGHCISQNRSGERTHQLPSHNAVGKHDVRVGQLHTLGQNTVYPFEWFWRNAQCISQNRSGERMHRLPSQNVTYGSESDQFDTVDLLIMHRSRDGYALSWRGFCDGGSQIYLIWSIQKVAL